MTAEKKKILILDERSDSLLNLFEVIDQEGFDTTGVSSKREAMSCVARRTPDVLVDHLRESTTTESPFLEKIRRLSPRTRIILLSSKDSVFNGNGRELSVESPEGIFGPYEPSEVIDALDHAVQERAGIPWVPRDAGVLQGTQGPLP